MKTPSPARQRTLALQDRALKFSVAVNKACPRQFTDLPSETVWRQLVRAADSVSNNLGEADDASSTADFVHKIRLTLREAKESRQCLAKIRLGSLDGRHGIDGLEAEASELAAIFATIALKVSARLDTDKPHKGNKR